jgi:hypothetical protein
MAPARAGWGVAPSKWTAWQTWRCRGEGALIPRRLGTRELGGRVGPAWRTAAPQHVTLRVRLSSLPFQGLCFTHSHVPSTCLLLHPSNAPARSCPHPRASQLSKFQASPPSLIQLQYSPNFLGPAPGPSPPPKPQAPATGPWNPQRPEHFPPGGPPLAHGDRDLQGGVQPLRPAQQMRDEDGAHAGGDRRRTCRGGGLMMTCT